MTIRAFCERVHGTSPFAGRFAVTAGTNFVLAFMGLATGVAAARLLGPQHRGELAAIQLWPSFIATIAMLGLPEAIVYFSAREPENAGRYLGSAMALALVASLPAVAIGYMVLPVVLTAQSAMVVDGATRYLLVVPLFALIGLPYHPLRGQGDFFAWNVLRLVPALGWLGVLGAAWWLGRAEPRFLAGSYLLVLAVLVLPVAAVVRRRVRAPYRPQLALWRPMLRYSLPSLASIVPQVLNLRLDQIGTAALLSAESLGLYVVASGWSSAINPVLGALGAVLFPRVAAQASRDGQMEALAQGCRAGVLMATALAVAGLLVTPWLLPVLFGAKFVTAVPIASILLVAAALGGINVVMQDGLRGLGRPTAVMWSEIGGLVVTAATLFPLLGRVGVTGAALSSVLGCGTVTALLVVQVRRVSGCTLHTLLCARGDEIRSTWSRMVYTVMGSAK